MRSQCLCNITYTAALLTHSLYGLPVLVMQTLVLSFRHVLCSFPSSFAFMVKKISVSEFLRSARSSFLLFPIKKENRQRLYNLLSIFILKLIEFFTQIIPCHANSACTGDFYHFSILFYEERKLLSELFDQVCQVIVFIQTCKDLAVSGVIYDDLSQGSQVSEDVKCIYCPNN